MAHGMREALDIAKRSLKKGRLALFVGAGVSQAPPSGLPSWTEFVGRLVVFAEELLERRVKSPVPPPKDRADAWRALLVDATAKASKAPIDVAAALKKTIQEIDEDDGAKKGTSTHRADPRMPDTDNADAQLRQYLNRQFAARPPNPYHEAIVRTKYSIILTTNYDDLLEEADRNGPRRWRGVSFKNTVAMLRALNCAEPLIVHMHGTMGDLAVGDLVFTTEDYRRIQRDHPAFTFAVQVLLMQKDFLFVGYGGTDPHLTNLLEDLQHMFRWPGIPTGERRRLIVRKHGDVSPVVEASLRRLRIEPVTIGDWSELNEMLVELGKAVPY